MGRALTQSALGLDPGGTWVGGGQRTKKEKDDGSTAPLCADRDARGAISRCSQLQPIHSVKNSLWSEG